MINPRGNIAFQNKSTPIQSYFPITEINIPIYQTPFTNLSSFNIKDNSLFRPLRHQQSIRTPSRLKKYYPLYLTTPEITQPTYHPPPVIIDNHEQQMILNHDQSSLHHYSSDYLSTISMNKQQNASDIELRPTKLNIQYIWKENKLDDSIDSYDKLPQPNDNCHNRNIIVNNFPEKSISITSQRPNIPPVLMICLSTNKFDKNETNGKIIKATKTYKYLVHHKTRLISIQTKQNTIDVRKKLIIYQLLMRIRH